MENSRRLLDRSRELGLKKPRLEEQKIIGRNSNARAFVQSPAEAASMRGRDSEGSDTTSRLGAIQELVSQYRTALSELTFNSKPIITNLTIIAGENLNAAKPIAAVICSNIIEVPTEQKLPSLYLLDSIVKNIGRDYIKYFAARLPEVFCKAYRQVDPAVHPGMRHLFGTWKNVFPPQSLQMIEKELGFPTAVSGSALGTATSKAVSQSQRPAQSIHVNPRYLEARERQQSSTVKGTINDMNGSLANSPDDTEKLERTTNVYSERRRADPRLKMHNIQHPPKNAGIELVQQKNSEFGTRDFSTELAKQSVLGIGKASDRVTEQRIDRAWYGSGSTVTGTTSNQSYGFDINLRQTNHLASRSATDDVHLQHSENLSGRSSIGMDRSWKNSEEEEYTWDDVNSRSTSYGVNRKSKRDPRFMDDSERLDSQSPRLQPQMLREIGSSVDREASGASLLFEQRNQTAFEKLAPLTEARATLGIGFSASDRTIPGHSDGHATSLNGLSTNANSMIKTSLNSSINSSFQQSIHIPSLHKFQSDPIQYDPSAPSHKPVLSQISTLKKSSKSSSGNTSLPGSEIPGQMSTSCLLTAVMESGILGKNSDIGGIPKLTCQTAISLPSQTSSRAAQPSDPPPTQLESKVASATLVSSLLHESTSVSLAQKETEQPPLPRKPPRSSIIGSASEETTTATSNPVSNLLNSLVSRGLISAAKTESSASIPLKNICDPHSQVQGTATASLMNSTRQVSSDISPSSTSKQLSLLKPTTETPVATHVSSVNEIKSHIGFEFKPEVIRVPHPVVISELLSDLPHQCGICGLRVRLKERFERHMEWHTLKKSDSDSSSKASRRWYVNSLDWVGEKVSTHKTSDVLEVSNKELENGDEQMVPADENHCVCVLCGELFEDLYNLKTDQWMFRGAVYLTLSTHSKITSTAVAQGPVVHASCISESSVRELGLANNVKVEEDA